MKHPISPGIIYTFADEIQVLLMKFTSITSYNSLLLGVFLVKVTHIAFCTIFAFKSQRNCSPSLSSEKNSATHALPKCSNSKITPWMRVLADHLIKRWKLVFITQERIKKTIYDLDKQRKKFFFFNLVGFGAIFYWERVSQISIWHQKLANYFMKGNCSRLFTVSFHSRHMEDCVWKTICFWKGHVASSEQWYHLWVKDKQNV